MRQCFFCENTADSLEHLWPQWILERVKPRGPMRHVIAGAIRSLGKPEMKMKCVCSQCNNGWMHDLEQRSIPVLGAMLRDIATPLDSEQQTTLSLWSTKTAIVVEATKPRSDRHFTQAERVELRKQSLIPSRTAIWLGRYASSGIGAYGTDLGFNIENFGMAAVGYATTVVVGHVALQVLAFRAVEQFNGQAINIAHGAGPWEDLLVQVWPVQTRVQWPPQLSFTNSGRLSITTLMDRWRIGEKVFKLRKQFGRIGRTGSCWQAFTLLDDSESATCANRKLRKVCCASGSDTVTSQLLIAMTSCARIKPSASQLRNRWASASTWQVVPMVP